jgi:hypothetical protein
LTRKNIVKHYNDIIQEEKMNVQKTNKSLALKLAPQSFISRMNFNVPEKKRKNGSPTDIGEKGENSVSNSLNFDESIQNQPIANDDMDFPK